jgi:regulatory protein
VKPELSLRGRALQYLARREYSRAELAAKLRPYLTSEPDLSQPIDLIELLDDLTTRGWLSDERAATQWVHAKQGRFGARRIAHDLQQKGISEEIIETALPALKENEFSVAHAVWQRKFSMLPQDSKEKARQVRFLLSRGFSMDVIFKVLRQREFADSISDD